MFVIGRPAADIDKVFEQIDDMVKLRETLGVPSMHHYSNGSMNSDPYCFSKYIKWYQQQEQSNETGS